MRVRSGCFSGAAFVAVLFAAEGQAAVAQASAPAGDAIAFQAMPLKAEVRRVGVDVVVTDAQGRPVTGLTREDFKIEEDNARQSMRFFDVHTAAAPEANYVEPKIPPLPSNTYLNLAKAPEYGTPTVILYDALNTPLNDQPAGHREIVNFIKHRRPGTQIAIFVLTGELHLLQGYTQDTDLLAAAMASKKGSEQTTTLLAPDGVGPTTATTDNPDIAVQTQAGPGQAAGSVSGGNPDQAFIDFLDKAREFDQQDQLQLQDQRVDLTLKALTDIGRFLAPIPGRKDLIWLSSAFPVGMLPDSTLTIRDPGDAYQGSEVHDREMRNYAVKIKQAADLLNLSHVSVYPVDVRGVRVNRDLSASSNASYGANPSFGGAKASLNNIRSTVKANTSTSMNLSQQTFVLDDEAARRTMDTLADDTGGHAFYGTNGLQQAVDTAMLSGATYYSLTYEPTNAKFDGGLRHIKVSLKRPGYNLSYRRTYYADDLSMAARAAADAPESPLTPALERGTPISHGLFFEAHLEAGGPPVPATPDQMRVLSRYVAMRSVGNKKTAAPVMMQQYFISYGLILRQLEMPVDDSGAHKASVELGMISYDDDGRKLNGIDMKVDDTIPAKRYAKSMSDGYHIAQSVAVPVAAASLRLAVRDVQGNRVGSLEVRLPLAKATDTKAGQAKAGDAKVPLK